jgi:murein L,D-transpeptidase YafK
MIFLLLLGILVNEDNASKVDLVIVEKSQHILTLLSHGKVQRTFKVALGRSPTGAKEKQGDHKTPEGQYILDRRNAKSRFYKSIHISYPNQQDIEKAQQRGFEAGGDIMIHGLPNGFGWLGSAHRNLDWTDGCIAVTDSEMDEIWTLVPDATAIEIRP